MSARLLAVVPVRGGVVPLGGAEAVAEAGGRVLLVGDGVGAAAEELSRRVRDLGVGGGRLLPRRLGGRAGRDT